MSTEQHTDSPLPSIRETGPLTFNLDDIDGQMAMLDPRFSGCLMLTFSAAMNPDVDGRVLLDGELIGYELAPVTFGPHLVWALGVRLIGRLVEHGRSHHLEIDRFVDEHGTVMAPRRIEFSTSPRTRPQAEFLEHDAVARRVAEEGTVLLENGRETLPLAPGQLNVFGCALHAYRTTILGAGKINPRYTVGLRDAIRDHPMFTLNEELAELYRHGVDVVPDAETMARARALSDVGIVVISRVSGENNDNASVRGEFYLTAEEESLVEAVAGSFSRSVVILNTPYPLDVRTLRRFGVDAVVLAGIAGMLAGPALLSVLAGEVCPSGHLPDTWALALDDIPSSRNFYDSGRTGERHGGDSAVWIDTVYEEDIYVGYRYFSTFDVEVAYPFGHGLSYTRFKTRVDGFEAKADSVAVDLMVTNIGDVEGREVVQVYLTKPNRTIEAPSLELVDFAKSPTLAPGESSSMSFAIPSSAWASWDEETACYVAEAGRYKVSVGRSVAEVGPAGYFELAEAKTTRESMHLMSPSRPIARLSRRDPQDTFPQGRESGIREGATSFPMLQETSVRSQELPAPRVPRIVNFSEVQLDPGLAEAFAATLSTAELARLVVCEKNGWGMEGTGVAGILAELQGRGLPLFQVADGNSGVNVRTPNIGMPTTVMLASTFDRDLAREVGRVIGSEARLLDVDVVLAPALNLHRHPLAGRHAEYFSEDPLLAGVMAGSFAAGIESTGVAACYKHLAANNAESARKRNDSVVSERALRDLYLKAFEVAMLTHPARTAMTAYNAINGVGAAAHADLILGFLRGDCGFDGFVMTDWTSYDTVDVVDMVLAGNDWITPGGQDDTWTQPIIDAVESGRLPIERLRSNVSDLLRVVAEIVSERIRRSGSIG
jgi:beta-glucosidase